MDERLRFIVLMNARETSFSALCAQFGISRKTGYKWVERYREHGPRGLEARRSVPLSCPHEMAPEMAHRLVELRKEHTTWGPKKLRARLQALGVDQVPAASTIGELLKKRGLIRQPGRRVFPPKTPSELAPAERPNDTWCVDFKGYFELGNKLRCHPLTITDHASRYLIKCEALTKTDVTAVLPHFDRAFREFGLPERIRSDNGSPFATLGVGGLSALSVYWVKLGITPERIDPGHPQQNGRHERMHKTLKQEATSPPGDTLVEQQRKLDCFRHEYNDVRPHEALDQKPPASQYSPSQRVMPSQPSSPEYPDSMSVRRVSDKGFVSVGGDRVFLSRLIANEPVGLLPTEEDVWDLYYGPVLLAEISVKNKEVKLVKRR